MKENKLKGHEDVELVGTIGDISQTLGAQFVEATEYVHKSKHPTMKALDEHFRTSKFKISWDYFTIGLKVSKQSANLKGASQCMADVAESVLDTSELIAFSVTAGFTWPVAAMKAVQLTAQLYATKVSCGEAVSNGLKQFKKMTAQQIKALVRIQAVMATRINEFVSKSMEVLAQVINPGGFDFSVIPKNAYEELAKGLLSSLELCALINDPIERVKTAASIKVSEKDAIHIANGILLANSPGKFKTASSFPQSFKKDVTLLANSYKNLNLPTAFVKVRDYLRISPKPSKKS